jgi:hypothetical protein
MVASILAQCKGDVVSNTALKTPGKDTHSRKHQSHTAPKATTKHSSKEKFNRSQAVPIGQRVAMKEGGGDGNESSMPPPPPTPPPEEEGIGHCDATKKGPEVANASTEVPKSSKRTV